MHRKSWLKPFAWIIVKTLRVIFRLPKRVAALIIFGGYKAAIALNLPPKTVSDVRDAWQAMRDDPLRRESLRRFMLKSDPVILEDFIFNTLRGDPPLEDIKPW